MKDFMMPPWPPDNKENDFFGLREARDGAITLAKIVTLGQLFERHRKQIDLKILDMGYVDIFWYILHPMFCILEHRML